MEEASSSSESNLRQKPAKPKFVPKVEGGFLLDYGGDKIPMAKGKQPTATQEAL